MGKTIDQITSTADTLNNNDYLAVASTTDGTTYTTNKVSYENLKTTLKTDLGISDEEQEDPEGPSSGKSYTAYSSNFLDYGSMVSKTIKSSEDAFTVPFDCQFTVQGGEVTRVMIDGVQIIGSSGAPWKYPFSQCVVDSSDDMINKYTFSVKAGTQLGCYVSSGTASYTIYLFPYLYGDILESSFSNQSLTKSFLSSKDDSTSSQTTISVGGTEVLKYYLYKNGTSSKYLYFRYKFLSSGYTAFFKSQSMSYVNGGNTYTQSTKSFNVSYKSGYSQQLIRQTKYSPESLATELKLMILNV